jgi:S-formylglutathione hydrolase
MRTLPRTLSRTFLLAALTSAAIAGASVAAAQTPPASPPASTYAGKLERITVHGPSLVGNLSGDSPDRQVSVYLPRSYATQPRRRYPVLYMLHGFTSTDERWFDLTTPRRYVNAPTATDRAVAGGALEMIIVMPNAFTTFQGSMYSNSVVTGDWEAYIARDLVAYIDAHYRTIATREGRGLSGHSMGGYGAIRIGMKYPQVFSSLYILSPCCMSANMEPTMQRFAGALAIEAEGGLGALKEADFGTKAMLASAAAWSPNPNKPPLYIDLPIADGKPVPDVVAKWAANAPLTMVHQYIPAVRSFDAIAVDAGDMDVAIAGTVRRLDHTLSAYGIAHTAEIYSGDHTNRIDERLETKVLPFFSAHLTFE